MLSVSKNVQIHNNTLEHNFRGHLLPQLRLGGGARPTLISTNNTARDNAITVGTQSGMLRAASAI